MSSPTIFTRFLTALGVPHTEDYSDRRFNNMTFHSLFGFSHLLKDYGIDSEGLKFDDKDEISKLTPPFLAQARNGVFVIVNCIDEKADKIEYDSLGVEQTACFDKFKEAWNGNALLAFPSAESKEPSYGSHHFQELVQKLSRWALLALAIGVFAYFFISRQIYAHWSTVLLTVFDCVGLYFSYLLVQKSLGIKSHAGDRVCGVLQKGGCDDIVHLNVSKLFGVFSWSEVGFGYFGVSLLTLLIFPELLPYLAICNVCCLPYTVWSITYQKFVAKKWCTLCVGVQCTLWLLFFCYLGGGWFHGAFPLRIDFFVLIAVYVVAVLGINLLLRVLKKAFFNQFKNEDDSKA